MIFKRYNPVNLLWIGVFALVFHLILWLYPLSHSLLVQLMSVVMVLTNVVAFCCVIFLTSRGATRAQWFFILILGLFAFGGIMRVIKILLGETFLIVESVSNPSRMFIGGFTALLFMLYPIEILRPHYLNFRTILKILSPLLVIVLLVIVSNYLKNDGQTVMSKLVFISSMLTIVGYPLCSLIYALKYQKLHKEWCEQNFSNLENLKTSWVKYYIIVYLFLSVSYLYLTLNTSQEGLLVQYTLFLLFFLFIFPFVLNQKELVEYPLEDEMDNNIDVQSVVEERLIYKNSSLMYKEKLIDWMEQDKPYLQTDFRLIDIMSVLPLNRSYISRLLNEEMGETFFSFVMKYRIEESARLLEKRHDLPVAQVAKESGFSSASVFGRSFIKDKGVTPLEYRKSFMFANK